MKALGAFLRIARPGVYAHWCPGCDAPHQWNISAADHPRGRRWGWDGDIFRPSVEPELEQLQDGVRCEYVLRAGVIHYLASCSHALAGRSVPLPAYPRHHPMELQP